MRKILAICAVLAMGGCSAVRDSIGEAKETLLNPPDQVWAAIKVALEFLISIVVNFFGDLGGRFGL